MPDTCEVLQYLTCTCMSYVSLSCFSVHAMNLPALPSVHILVLLICIDLIADEVHLATYCATLPSSWETNSLKMSSFSLFQLVLVLRLDSVFIIVII